MSSRQVPRSRALSGKAPPRKSLNSLSIRTATPISRWACPGHLALIYALAGHTFVTDVCTCLAVRRSRRGSQGSRIETPTRTHRRRVGRIRDDRRIDPLWPMHSCRSDREIRLGCSRSGCVRWRRTHRPLIQKYLFDRLLHQCFVPIRVATCAESGRSGANRATRNSHQSHSGGACSAPRITGRGVIGVDLALEHLDGLEHHPHATSPGGRRSQPGAVDLNRPTQANRPHSYRGHQLARHLQLSRGTVRKADLAEHRGRQPHSVNQSKRLTTG